MALALAVLVGCAPGTVATHEARASAVAPESAPPRAGSGALAHSLWMPVAGVRVADVEGNFGVPRGDRIHEGLDIFAPEGTPVYSAGDGVVAWIGHTERGGWSVAVSAGAREIWYTHLQAVAPTLHEKDRVTHHTLVGYVGATGNAAGGPPHLHFEVVGVGGPVDPLPLLRDRP